MYSRPPPFQIYKYATISFLLLSGWGLSGMVTKPGVHVPRGRLSRGAPVREGANVLPSAIAQRTHRVSNKFCLARNCS